MNATTTALIAAARFHALAATAAANGGFWVSGSGGTANVVAGEIARATGVSFDEAHWALEETADIVWGTRDGWSSEMAYAQPVQWENALEYAMDDGFRWDARIIARAACRPVRVMAGL